MGKDSEMDSQLSTSSKNMVVFSITVYLKNQKRIKSQKLDYESGEDAYPTSNIEFLGLQDNA